MADMQQYSEYIYRYLDGDLSEVESGVLFTALSHDTSLQQEFSDALSIKSIALQEAKATVVPTALTAKVLQQANVGVAVHTHTANVGRLLSYAGVLVLGFLLSMWTNWQVDEKQPSTAKTPHITEQTTAIQANSLSPESGKQLSNKVVTQFANSSGSEKILKQQVDAEVIGETTSEMMSIPSTEPKTLSSPILASLSNGVDAHPIDIASKQSFFDDVSITLQRSSIFSSNDIRANSPALLDDLAISLDAMISSRDFIGLHMGVESVPLYVKRDDGTVASRKSVRWLGTTYMRVESIADDIPVRVFGRLTAGAAQSGPIGKVNLGLAWQMVNSISINAGVEGTQILLQNNGEWFGIQRFGLNTGVNINFSQQ